MVSFLVSSKLDPGGLRSSVSQVLDRQLPPIPHDGQSVSVCGENGRTNTKVLTEQLYLMSASTLQKNFLGVKKWCPKVKDIRETVREVEDSKGRRNLNR